MERALRKIKPWLDSAEKLKTRHASLLLFLELTGEAEQAVFFREHRVVLYEYCLACFKYFATKIVGDAEYRNNTERLLKNNNAKEWAEHFRVQMALSLVFRFAAIELVNGGPEERYYSDIIKIVCTLLHVSNHPVLRRDGLFLLLLWLRDTRLPPGIVRDIFGESVRLGPFVEANNQTLPDGIKQHANDNISGPSKSTPPLFPTPLSPLQQAVAGLRDLLSLMTFEMESGVSKASIAIIYQYFKESFVAPFYTSGNHSIPEPLQVILVEFYALWTVQFLPDGHKSQAIPATCFMMSQHLTLNPEEMSLVNRVLQEGHLLSYNNAPAVRTAMAVVRQWIFSSKERRPDFLNKPDAEDFVALYLKMTASIFNGRPFIGFQQEQISLYRDAISFLRQLIIQPLAGQTIKNQIVAILLELGRTHFACPNKYSVIVTPGVAEDFSGYYGETLFTSIVRSANCEEGMWRNIGSTCQALTHWGPFVSTYGDILVRLTEFMLDQVVLGRPPMDARPGTPKGSKMSVESVDSGRASPRPSDFPAWQTDPSLPDRIVFIWRNLLAVFGPMCAVDSPPSHASLTKALVAVTDRLMAVREQQAFNSDLCPPVLDALEQIIQAAASEADLEGRTLAIQCLGGLAGSNKLALALSGDHELRILDVLVRALASPLLPAPLEMAVLEACSLLFNSQLINSRFILQLLVPHLLPVISQPTCQSLPISIGLLGNIVSLTGSPEAWAAIGGFYAHYRSDLASLDIILPVVACLTTKFLASSEHGSAKQGIAMLVDSLTPIEHSVPAAAIPSAEALFQWFGDCRPSDALGDDTFRFIAIRLLAIIRSTFIATTAGNPKGPQQDRLGAALLSLLARFLGHVGSNSWLEQNPDIKKQLFDCLQESQETQSHQLSLSAAHRLLHFLALRMATFASPVGPESVDCHLDPAEEHGLAAHFIVHDDTIVSVYPHRHDLAQCVLVLRGVAGRMVWSIASDLAPDTLGLPVESSIDFPCSVRDKLDAYSEYAGPWPVEADDEHEHVIPRYAPGEDMIGRLIDYLHGGPPDTRPATMHDEGAMVASLCRDRFAGEMQIAEKYDEAVQAEYQHPPAPAALRNQDVPKYSLPRQWLSSLGILTKEAFASKSIAPLRPSAALSQDIRSLDLRPSRLCVKAALIYVPYGRETESDIFNAEHPEVSKNYQLFSQALGWLVQLDRHRALNGYSAGLDTSDTSSGLARYYSDAHVEIAWHDSTQLTGGLEDKRRCLGSDLIHVIWNEHVREYRAASIRGAVEISISPLSATHCQVRVTTSNSSIEFGPLCSTTVQPLATIGSLVRSTVISAHLACLAHLSRQPAVHPYSHIPLTHFRFNERAGEIRTIQRKHGCGIGLHYANYLTLLSLLPPVTTVANMTAAAGLQNYRATTEHDLVNSPIQASRVHDNISNYGTAADADGSEYEDAVSEIAKLTV